MKAQNGGGNYAPAPTKEVEVLLDFAHDKSARTCCEKCALSFCGLGFVILLSSLVAGFLLKPYVNSRIAGAMALAEGEPAFLGWKDPPVTPVMKVFLFISISWCMTNVTHKRQIKMNVHMSEAKQCLRTCV